MKKLIFITILIMLLCGCAGETVTEPEPVTEIPLDDIEPEAPIQTAPPIPEPIAPPVPEQIVPEIQPPIVAPPIKEKCALEGEYTSGPVSPEYQFTCCAGLTGFNTQAHKSAPMIGGGLLCYDMKKGVPKCNGIGTRSEGWYYPDGSLIKWDNCYEEPVIETKPVTMQYSRNKFQELLDNANFECNLDFYGKIAMPEFKAEAVFKEYKPELYKFESLNPHFTIRGDEDHELYKMNTLHVQIFTKIGDEIKKMPDMIIRTDNYMMKDKEYNVFTDKPKEISPFEAEEIIIVPYIVTKEELEGVADDKMEWLNYCVAEPVHITVTV